jgi:hypothetical protein
MKKGIEYISLVSLTLLIFVLLVSAQISPGKLSESHAHLRQSCRSCHFTAGEDGLISQEFSQLSSSCISCHQDLHNGQFEGRGGKDCLKCHGFDEWSASKFDHDQTAFKLDGKHKDLACQQCHVQVVTAEITYTEFKLKNYACESCL